MGEKNLSLTTMLCKLIKDRDGVLYLFENFSQNTDQKGGTG